MATYWNIVCKTCGTATDFPQTHLTKSRGKMFHKLASDPVFAKIVKMAFEIEDAVRETFDSEYGGPSVHIEIGCGPTFSPTECFTRECANHEFDALCQYGEDYPCGCV